MRPSVIHVLIVDDHAYIRKGVRAFLEEVEDIEVVGEAADGIEAIAQSRALKPEVILMDIVMPHMDGVEAISQITTQQEGVRVIALTSFATDDKIFPAIKSGALGYLLKDSSPEELVAAIHQVYRGEPSLHPQIARRVLQEISQPPTQTRTDDPLTEREVEVLKLIARGMSNQEIAEQLVISETTVRTHVSRILSKLHLASRTQAALYALKEGLAELDDEIET